MQKLEGVGQEALLLRDELGQRVVSHCIAHHLPVLGFISVCGLPFLCNYYCYYYYYYHYYISIINLFLLQPMCFTFFPVLLPITQGVVSEQVAAWSLVACWG